MPRRPTYRISALKSMDEESSETIGIVQNFLGPFRGISLERFKFMRFRRSK